MNTNNIDNVESIHHEHDKAYKYLLSVNRIFVELLQSFVAKDWVDRIDERHLTKVDKSYILQDFREKEADIVYRMRLQDRQVIFYVLMELQSSVDFQMPYRLLQYMMEVWRDVLKNTDGAEAARKGFKLPAIVPIVLYNGESSWTVCRRFRETLDGEEWFGNELPDFQYILIDIHRYDEQSLLELSNVIGLVFLLDRKTDLHVFIKRLEQATPLLENISTDLFYVFKTWIKMVTSRGQTAERNRKINGLIDQFKEPKEAGTMISNLEKMFEEFEINAERNGMKKGFDKGFEQGIEKGIEEGIEKGIEEGIEKVARRMMGLQMDIPTIMKATGLTFEQIENIKKRV